MQTKTWGLDALCDRKLCERLFFLFQLNIEVFIVIIMVKEIS